MTRITNRLKYAWHSLLCRHDLMLIQSCVDEEVKQKLTKRYNHHERLAVKYKARITMERYEMLNGLAKKIV